MIFACFTIATNNIGQIAMVTRTDGTVGLPGGKVDPNENPFDCVNREATEEGWMLDINPNPFFSAKVNNNKCLWFRGKIKGLYLDYKEKNRIIPFYADIGTLAMSGMRNNAALNAFYNNLTINI